ncbi:MAG: nitroreductase family protein [Anaerolineales bacterium]|nr:nitroreductase family protein [Anaerolineales bacterium]
MTSTTDLHNFLRTRRSIRRFKPDPVPDSVIENILHTATFAPSAHNRQPWRFAVVTDSSVKTKLADAMAVEFAHDLEKDSIPSEEIQKRIARSRERIISAPVVITLNLDMSEMDVYPDKKRKKAEYLMATQSVANAGMQLLLAAHAEGLGGVWVCSPLFVPETIQSVLTLPETWEPQAMFFVGYPDGSPKEKTLKDVKTIAVMYTNDHRR